MEIKDFTHEHIRVSREWPVCLDIDGIPYGIQASFHHYEATDDELKRAELRFKDHAYALFLFDYTEDEATDLLPEWWRDSKVVWELKPKGGTR